MYSNGCVRFSSENWLILYVLWFSLLLSAVENNFKLKILLSWNCEWEKERWKEQKKKRWKLMIYIGMNFCEAKINNTALSHFIGPQLFFINEFCSISSFIFLKFLFLRLLLFFFLLLLSFIPNWFLSNKKKICLKTKFTAGYYWVENIFFLKSIPNGIGYFGPASAKKKKSSNNCSKKNKQTKHTHTHKYTNRLDREK